MFVFDDIYDEFMIDFYKNRLQSHFESHVKQGSHYFDFYPTRNIVLPIDELIVEDIQKILENRLNASLTCAKVELQTWPADSFSPLHAHEPETRLYPDEDFNSVLYLNEDFEGGEFFTDNGIRVQPKKNRLTFFNGKEEPHGLEKVTNGNRYTLILWWRNTIFY